MDNKQTREVQSHTYQDAEMEDVEMADTSQGRQGDSWNNYDNQDNSYRLVNKEYYCFLCEQKKKKLSVVQDLLQNGLLCDTCGQGFCEIIDIDNDFEDMVKSGAVNQKVEDNQKVEEIKKENSIPQNAVQGGSMLSQLITQNQQDGDATTLKQSSLIGNPAAIEKDEADLNRPPQVTVGKRESLRNTNKRSDTFGRPLDQVDLRNTNILRDNDIEPERQNNNQNRSQIPEEEKVGGRQNNGSFGQRQSQYSQSNPGIRVDTNNQSNSRSRRARNPFIGTGNFMQSFFGDDSPFRTNIEDDIDFSAFGGNQQQAQQSQNGNGINISMGDPSGGGGFGININTSSNMGGQSQQHQQQSRRNRNQNQQNVIFNQFFRPFSFTSMFNDDEFQDMSEAFEDFNPHEFGVNYSQNFRSSMPRRSRAQQNQQQHQGNQRQGFFQQMRGGPSGLGGLGGGMSFEELAHLVNQQMQAQAMAEEEAQRRPTDQQFVARLPEVSIEQKHCKKGIDGKLEMPACSVCLTDFEMGNKGIFLPCGHIFHPDCIKPWLKDHNTCPVCRKELPTQRN